MNERKIDTEMLLRRVNLPDLHKEARLGAIPDVCPHKKYLAEVVESVKDFVGNGDNLLFWGDFGTGKSACASIILKAALSRGIVGFWTSYENYVDGLMSDLWFSDDLSFVDRCREVPILVLDELIIRANSKEKETMVEVLIRHRMEKKLSTVITTNHPPSWLRTNHRSLYSVFGGHYTIIEAKGHNFRA